VLTLLHVVVNLLYLDAQTQEKFEEHLEKCEGRVENLVEKEVGRIEKVMERLEELMEKEIVEIRKTLKSLGTRR